MSWGSSSVRDVHEAMLIAKPDSPFPEQLGVLIPLLVGLGTQGLEG